jgi:uncharacterized protein (DUF58 family)
VLFRRKRTSPATQTGTPIRRRPGGDISVTGFVYFGLTIFMGLAAINTQANLLFGVFGLMVGIMFVSIWASGVVLRKIELTRRLPDHAIVGQPTSVAYEFKNRKRYWPSVSLTIAELEGVEAFARQPQGYVLHAAAGMTATIPVELVPKRRGLAQLGLHQIGTSFPFGFIKRAVERDRKDTLLVYPAIGMVDKRLLQMCKSAESMGPTVRPRRGGMDEFYGLKEYRQGESPRFIYWKRSARTGTLVSREMTHTSPPRITILLDTFIAQRTPAHHADVEICIAMAASLISFVLESDLPVGLVVWSDEFKIIEPQRGKRHRRDLLTMLAQLPLNTGHDASGLLAKARNAVDTLATPILISPQAESRTGSMIAIRPHTRQAEELFKFDEKIEFAHAMPVTQMVS